MSNAAAPPSSSLSLEAWVAPVEELEALPEWRSEKLELRDAALAAAFAMAGPEARLEDVRLWTADRLCDEARATKGTAKAPLGHVVARYVKGCGCRKGTPAFPSEKKDAFGKVASVGYGHAWRLVKGAVCRALGVGQVERPLDLVRGLSTRLADAAGVSTAGEVEVPPTGWGPDGRIEVEAPAAPPSRYAPPVRPTVAVAATVKEFPSPRVRAVEAPPEEPSPYVEMGLGGPTPEGFEATDPAGRFCRLVAKAAWGPKAESALAGGRFKASVLDRLAYHRRFLGSPTAVARIEAARACGELTWASGAAMDPSRPPWGCFEGEEGAPFGSELAEWYEAYGDSLSG